MDLTRPWVFDRQVADVFDSHVRQNIPGYEAVIDDCLEVTRMVCLPGDPIAEIGCATGYTIDRLEELGFTNIVGVDNSSAMLEKCRPHTARLLCSDSFPVEYGPFKSVLLNWTLHFVEPTVRKAYLKTAIHSVANDGVLLVTEKTCQSPLTENLYHRFKRTCGMSEEAIAAKKKSLMGVLQPLPHEWYSHTFTDLNCSSEILRAQFGFVTYLVRHR